MFKKFVSMILSMLMIVGFSSTAAFAADNNVGEKIASSTIQNENKPMLYYYFGDNGAYKVSKTQFEEITKNHNLSEVILRDGLVPVSPKAKSNMNVKKDTQMNVSSTTSSGHWDITSNSIRPGQRTTYYMPNGSSFVVGSGEEINCSIGPDRACWLTVGATGTKSFEVSEYIDLSSYYGITIGTATPGSYKFYAENTDNDFTITVKGGIDIS